VNVSDPHKDVFIEKPMVINLNGSAYLINKKIPLTDKSEKGKLTSLRYIFECYNEFLNKPGSAISHELIHTHFHDRSYEQKGK
jgi:hypothetical protein